LLLPPTKITGLAGGTVFGKAVAKRLRVADSLRIEHPFREQSPLRNRVLSMVLSLSSSELYSSA
jgi:hypothetical protein